MFAERPEEVAVGLSNGDAINFPVDYMATTNTSAEVRNLQLAISLTVSVNTTPTFTYPRGGAGSGASSLTYIRVCPPPPPPPPAPSHPRSTRHNPLAIYFVTIFENLHTLAALHVPVRWLRLLQVYARKGLSLVLSSSRKGDDQPNGVLATPTDSSTAASDRTTLAAELAKAGRVPISDLPASRCGALYPGMASSSTPPPPPTPTPRPLPPLLQSPNQHHLAYPTH